MSDSDETGPRGALFGVFLVVVGLFTLFAVGGIRSTTFGDNSDPGPRALPTVLAVCLVLGGVGEIISARLKCRRARPAASSVEATTPPADSNHLDAGILLGALIVYIAAIPWVGFTLCTLLFTVGMMWRLKIGWVLNLSVSFGLILVVHLLFVVLFRVQLPAGRLGLPF